MPDPEMRPAEKIEVPAYASSGIHKNMCTSKIDAGMQETTLIAFDLVQNFTIKLFPI